jgi:hypothetical protein
MPYTGEYHPNYGEMGMESMIPQGTGRATPYGQADPTSQAPLMATNSMAGNGVDSAKDGTGYHPETPYYPAAGRADRLSANIVGGTGNFNSMSDGGYGGMSRGQGLTVNQ